MDKTFLNYESFIVGRLCQDGDQIFGDVFSNLTEDDFQLQDAKAVFKACHALTMQQMEINPVAIVEQTKLQGHEVSTTFIKECINTSPTNNNVVLYAQKIHEKAEETRLRALLSAVVDGLASESITLDEARADTEEALSKITYSDEGIVSADIALQSALQDMEDRVNGKITTISTGYPSIDRYFSGGLENGALYIIGARPACGKSTLAMNLANHIALQNRRVLFVSLEMTKEQLSRIRLQMVGYINHDDLFYVKSEEVQTKIQQASEVIRKHPVDFNKAQYLTVSYISKLCRSRHYDVVIIDYLQLVTPKGGKTRYEEVTRISRGLKGLALQQNIPVICLSQLNRGSALDRPKISDLRDSGAIEQDADAVMLLYLSDRADVTENRPSTLEVSIAKNRYGGIGTVELDFYMKSRVIKDRSIVR